MSSGLVFNIQRYSIHDGPGIRTTVFLKGCPLRCWWCHNPESLSPKSGIIVVETRCMACGECLRVCPNHAHQADNHQPGQNNGRCTLCGACVAACPSGARQIAGKAMTVPEVIAEIAKDIPFYDESGGGATFSGGEPLSQPEFLADLLAACRTHGIQTAVDTCGFGPTERLLSIAPLTDVFLYDIKFIREDLHLRYTGVSNALILENLKILGLSHKNIWIRVPIIQGINDDTDQLTALARFVSSIPGVRQLNLLPYHTAGMSKYTRSGHECRMEQTPSPKPEYIDMLRQKLCALGINAKTGG